jgi:hypothetical protein
MHQVIRAAAPKVTGLIAIVCEGQTKRFRYSCAPVLLMADLHRAGFHLRKPPIFHRVGIPGSGGPDWLRNDYEPIVCITRPGKLPWSDNTALGHPPTWAPGGALSHRVRDGHRVGWAPNGTTAGDLHNGKGYDPPVLANPGNVIKCNVGGGQLGDKRAHRNEAPFPLKLAEFFVRSFCAPNGLVVDPFAGSGTTGHAAKKWGRRFAGCDIRESQVDLCRRRLADVPTELFV